MELYEYKYEVLSQIRCLVDEFQLDITEIKFINTNRENKLFKLSITFNESGKSHTLECEFTKDNFKKDISNFYHIVFDLCLKIIGI